MRLFLVAFSIAALGLIACQPTQTSAESVATFCGDLRALNRSAVALSATTGAATVGEFQQRMKAVDDAWTDVKESAKAVPQARTNELEAAVNDLKQTVGSIPNDSTLVQAGQTVAPKVVAVGRERQQLGNGVKCPSA